MTTIKFTDWMKSRSLRFSKVRDVKSPQRANPTDAGMDMFVPEITPEFRDDFNQKNQYAYIDCGEIVIPAHGRACIPSGCHFDIDEGWALIANNKSGVATKYGLVFGAAVCDSDYQGEVHISLINTGKSDVRLSAGQKVIQFLYMPVRLDQPVEVPFEELYNQETNRGAGGFGSTGEQ
jgi:dUTP pyrophosphatase